MSKIAELANIPEISFTDNLTLEELIEQVGTDYNTRYKELTGETPTLGDASPEKLLQYAIAMQSYQMLQAIEAKGKAELLATSEGDDLDALAAIYGITRKEAERATVTLRFTLAATRTSATGIPAGTRVRTEDGVYFNTLDYAEIPAGSLTVDVEAQAEEAGTASDGIAIGAINTLVDPIAYMQSVENITASTGGTDEEDDESLTERMFLSPSVLSCAGPSDAYEYYAKAWRNDVDDVKVENPLPSEVVIYFVLDDGVLPTDAECESMESYFADEDEVHRPLTDKVTCSAPSETAYTIELTYYIASSDKNRASAIEEAVAAAVTEYKTWQRKLGRDVNPSKLNELIMTAGAKRVALTAPVHTVVEASAIARCDSESVTYGGLEDD